MAGQRPRQGVDPTTLLDMIHPILHVADPWGVVLRREAIARGCNDNVLHRLVRDGTLIRLRQGIYALRSKYLAADNKMRHLMLCRGVMRLYAGHIALSHGSAALAQGGPDYGLDRVNVHVTHLVGGGRNVARVVHHEGQPQGASGNRTDGGAGCPARCVHRAGTDRPTGRP